MSSPARSRVATRAPKTTRSWEQVLAPELSFEFEADEQKRAETRRAAAGMRTRSINSTARLRASARLAPRCTRKASPIW
ncbi:MAG: hypothetical protein ACK4N5_02850 [Myxococcales bacterium]